MKRLVLTIIINTLNKLHLDKPLAVLFCYFISEYKDGSFHRLNPLIDIKNIHKKTTNILFFDSHKFRGEIELFSNASDIRIFTISWGFLGILIECFINIPKETLIDNDGIPRTSDVDKYLMYEKYTGMPQQRQKYKNFLCRVLPILYKKLNINVTINSNCRYLYDIEWVAAGEKINTPHICYYREALHTIPSEYFRALKRAKRYKHYPGKILAVQNQCTKDLFIESGIKTEKDIIIRGAPRMDKFVTAAKKHTPNYNGNIKQITFFSAPPRIPYYDSYENYRDPLRPGRHIFRFDELTRQTVKALCEMAIQHSNLRIVFKIKDLHLKGDEPGNVLTFYETLKEVSGNKKGPDNVIIETGRMAAQDIIFESDIICGVQSTALLEAAIAKKPVILLHYNELKRKNGANACLIYKNYEHLFDVPKDTEDLKKIIAFRLENPKIEETILKQRYEAFEELISFLDGTATEKSLNLIRTQAKNHS